MPYSQQVQAPLDYDAGSRVTSEIRTNLKNFVPEIAAGVKAVADAAATPDKPRSNR